MRSPLFTLNYHHYQVNNWEEKKKHLLQWMEKRTMVRRETKDGMVSFWTDRFSEHNDIQGFCDIFKEELDEFAREHQLEQMTIEDIWTVKYEKGDHHTPHDHGNCNYSFVLYVDYDENEHTGTQFISPIGDSTTNRTWIASPATREGQIVVFPSNVLHFTLPNKSDKIRTIVSIDISTSKTPGNHH